MKKALCLQGGGAKGAFQAGALKALTERGYKFDCAVGASVGCLNAAMYALGKVDELYDLWKELDFADVLPVERSREGGGLTLRSIASAAIDAIRSSGVDTARIRAILERHVDEAALRASSVRFGLVTVRSENGSRTLERLFIEDIPQGKVIDYMMASAALPFFRKVEIDGVRYLDGGIMDNLPIEMLADVGYRDITAIRLGGDIRYESGKRFPKIRYIDPSESAGHTINFSNTSITRSLNLGYFDVLRETDGLVGKRYYIKPFGGWRIRRFLRAHSTGMNKAIEDRSVYVGRRLGAKINALTLFLAEALGVQGDKKEVWTAFTEFLAGWAELSRWKVYSWEELLAESAKRLKNQKEYKGDSNKAKAFAIARRLFEE